MVNKGAMATSTNNKMSRPLLKPSVSVGKPKIWLDISMAFFSAALIAAFAILLPGKWVSVKAQVSSIQADLQPFLSANAFITVAGSTTFKNLTERWSQYDAPNMSVAVSAATAEDIQQTACLSNRVATIS